MAGFVEVALYRSSGNELKTLSYSVPAELQQLVKPGQLINVPLGKKNVQGIIINLHEEQPSFSTKDITALIDEKTLLQDWQIRLLQWMSEHYFCSIHSALKTFIPSGILKPIKRPRKEKETKKIKQIPAKKLTPDQENVLKSILESDGKKFLIHGITGAGKTEIYLQIAQQLQENEQLLLLVPEISLTPQLIEYFALGTGEEIASIHSRLSEGEKRNIWKKIHEGKVKIVIGSRSALFAPYPNLKRIIIDEEHEWSYKQDQTPRYHAREVAEKMCEILPDCKMIMGSATPSIESYYKSTKGEYRLLELHERAIAKSSLPQVTIVDLREELQKKNYSIFSDLLQEKIAEKLAKKEQVILFLNRRGAASSLSCRECGNIIKCDHCDVAMTYHNSNNNPRLICHYCGIIKPAATKCPSCSSIYIKLVGVGTQKIEQEAKKLFPEAKIFRADRDTTSHKDSFTDLYSKLRDGEIDILIGTQMIGKGLHLPKVNLVGVILADIGLHVPDFRSSEKTFQTITQVAGRSGRKDPGEVIIQTYLPKNEAIACAQQQDYQAFYHYEIAGRALAHYPPFAEVIRLLTTDIDKQKCLTEHSKMLAILQEKIREQKIKNIEILAHPALIERIHNKYRYVITLKGSKLEELILPLMPQLHKWKIDRDPYWS